MLFIPLISLKECVSFSNSRHLISYFILEWTSLAECIRSVRHMPGLKYQSVQASVMVLLNTGVPLLTADVPLYTIPELSVTDCADWLAEWISTWKMDAVISEAGTPHGKTEINQLYLPCSTVRRPKSSGDGGNFHIICQVFSLQHLDGRPKNIVLLCPQPFPCYMGL